MRQLPFNRPIENIRTIPLPPNRDSSHRLTVESPENKHIAGVV
jgi:hypothetical protein